MPVSTKQIRVICKSILRSRQLESVSIKSAMRLACKDLGVHLYNDEIEIIESLYSNLTKDGECICFICKKEQFTKVRRSGVGETSMVFRKKTICNECANTHDRDFDPCKTIGIDDLSMIGNPSQMCAEVAYSGLDIVRPTTYTALNGERRK